ncbi:MAG: hypothetical protein MK180_06970 [Rhodobacteraceae bacterium]|nr:hypothetical protein [Paracoccaceae bacterium]
MVVGSGLIAAIYLQPTWAVAVAQLMPSPIWIGSGLCATSVVGLGLRIIRERRVDVEGSRG